MRTDLPRFHAAAIGVVAVGAAAAAGHLLSAFLGRNSSPVVAVGNTVAEFSPSWLTEFGKDTFYLYDKLALFVGMGVVMLVLAAVAGLVSRRSRTPGLVLIGVFGVLGVVAVLRRPDLGQLAIVAPLATLLVGCGVFSWLHGRAFQEEAVDGGLSRRGFLIAGAGAGVAAVAGEVIGVSRDAEVSRAAVGGPVPARPAPPLPADADFSKLGTPTFLTPNADFYKIDTTLALPQVRAEDWRLRVHGLVERELTFSYADIRDRPLVERAVTLCCVSNEVGGELISTATFVGVDLRDLLTEAGLRPEAEQLFSTSSDGWTCGTPISAVLDPSRGAMLALGMNGEPLPVKHGFPARLVVPGLYGYVSATKWVTDLEVTTWSARRAYWLDRGWSREGPVKTQSRIDVPKPFAAQAAGKTIVAGIAWAQHTGIERVEVRLDQGPWQPATLTAEVNADTWRMWWVQLDVPPGPHQVYCRAVDRSGYVQTEDVADTVPDGATGWHSISITAS
ncbi:molybdopterin-dependent oxidoreductase [Saccharothrix sp. AJ9571]|nr:molybdopterin-dependent oxidoreductase [Saccharothrix sp. AJ9571]